MELTDAKKKRETELLEKFCVLLNEKKVKIRELQGLVLAGGGTGRGKRKVRDEEDEEDVKGEMMDVDEGSPVGSGREDEEEEEAGRVTPGGETETGSEGEEEPSYSFRSAPPATAAGKGKGKAREVTPPPTKPVRAARRKPTASPEPVAAQASIAHRTRHAAAAVAAKPDEGSETESDDEL